MSQATKLPRTPTRRFARGLLIHILGPAIAWLIFAFATSYWRYHGPTLDLFAMVVILAANFASLWVAEWNVGYRWYTHGSIGIAVFAASAFLMLFVVVWVRMSFL